MVKHIQVLRALACLAVVFVHLSYLQSVLSIPSIGRGGVDLFFVISGFIMVHTTMLSKPTASDFFRNRVARIVPIYWTITLSVYVLALLMPQLLNSTKSNLIELIKSLLFIPFIKSNGEVQPVLFVGWTLNYEMFFYAIFSIGLLFKKYYAGIIFNIFVLMALTFTGVFFSSSNVILKFYTNPIVAEFALGMLVRLCIEYTPTSARIPTKIAMLLTLLGFPVLLLAPVFIPSINQFLLCGIPSAILVFGCVLLERWNWSLNSSSLIIIGNASYVMYLCHPYVTQSIERLAESIRPTYLLALTLIFVALSMSTLLGIFLHAVLERPLSACARRQLFGAN